MNTSSESHDAFSIERHGEITIIDAAPSLEQLDPSLIDGAAALLLEPLRHQEAPMLIVDLSRVDFFGSTFLGLLIRCWKLALVRGGMMALSGVSPRARELLRQTSLDVVWPIYADRREAMESMLAD
jgi:anti-sigma B factor antagonist